MWRGMIVGGLIGLVWVARSIYVSGYWTAPFADVLGFVVGSLVVFLLAGTVAGAAVDWFLRRKFKGQH